MDIFLTNDLVMVARLGKDYAKRGRVVGWDTPDIYYIILNGQKRERVFKKHELCLIESPILGVKAISTRAVLSKAV